jgi:hypothetical protein
MIKGKEEARGDPSIDAFKIVIPGEGVKIKSSIV